MKRFLSKEFIIFIVVGLLVLAAFAIFLRTPAFSNFYLWAQNNLALFIALIFTLRLLSIVYPPLAGGIFTLGSIPILGWEWAFAIDFAGTTLGGVINYFIGREYGIKVVEKIMGSGASEKISKLKFKPGREIEGIIVARVFFGLVMLEFIHYAAGLLKINFFKYLVAIVLSHLMLALPLFYLMNKFIDLKDYWYALLPLLILLPVLYKYRGRYFEI